MNPQAESRRPARHLNGESAAAIAADYDGRAVTFAVAQPGRRPAR